MNSLRVYNLTSALCLIIVFWTQSEAVSIKCPSGYALLSNSNLCYKYVSAHFTWDAAAVNCKGDGQELVSWNNDQHIGVLLQGEARRWGQTVWIGLRDFHANSHFYWMDVLTEYTYQRGHGLWAPKEPSSSGEHCAQFHRDKHFRLNDESCGSRAPFFCKACSVIDRCLDSHCQSGPNSRSKCNSCTWPYKPSPDKRQCEKICEYRNPCWPGTCGWNYLRECKCENGFRKLNINGKNQCQLSPSKKPEIETCRTKVFGTKGRSDSKSNSTSTHCDFMQDFFGNFQPDFMYLDITATFLINVTTFPMDRNTYLIDTAKFGVTDVNVKLLKTDLAGNVVEYGHTTQLNDSLHGQTFIETFNRAHNFSVSTKLANGDRLCMEIEVKGAGRVVTKNLSMTTQYNHTYDKTVTTRTICYIMDTCKPIHKSEINISKGSPFEVSERITRTGFINVSFADWMDPVPKGGNSILASGLSTFEISIYELKYANDSQSKGSLIKPTYIINETDITTMELNLTFVSPRIVCLVLEVKDIAENVRFARRFVLSDSSSSIEVDNSKSFRVSSASPYSDYKWQTHHNAICLSWQDYFFNEVYLNNHFLSPISPDPDTLGIYEQETGDLPITGTPNVHGILAFNFSWSRNGGDFQEEGTVSNFLNQKYCQNITINDGETYTLNITSIDIVNNTYTDSRTVAIDRSVPHINNIFLLNNGYESLFAHGDKDGDLTEITITFDVLDPHSGIDEILWAFGTNDGGHELVSKNISVNDTENCDHIDHCLCPSIGNCQLTKHVVSLKGNSLQRGSHNRNYYFTIKATNKARLSNIEHIEILVDISPPITGVVFEGPRGSPDIDFTSSTDFMVNWDGFVDHESGIKAYRVALAQRCLTIAEMTDVTRLSAENETLVQYIEVPFTERSTRLEANFTGHFYVTVAALNNAVQLSMPACSDGITYDLKGPSVRNVTLLNGRWRETLHCENGRAWLLYSSLSKVLLDPSPACSSVCVNVSHSLELPRFIPERTSNSTDGMVSEFICMNYYMYHDDVFIYLPSDHIELIWDSDDHGSQIEDAYVGFGTDNSNAIAPDLMGYQSTNKQNLYRQNHAGFSADDPFYVFIKMVNKASLETIAILGPVIIDETPPVKKLPVNVTITNDKVVVGWENDTFVDPEQEEPITSIFFQIESDGKSVTPLLEWNRRTSARCANYSGGCITYPLQHLQSKDTITGRPYTVVLFVYNNAGHMLRSTTHVFRLPSKYPPGHGIVHDVDPADVESTADISAHTSHNTLCVYWKGFEHHEHISLEIAAGSLPNSGTVYPYQRIPNNGTACLRSATFKTDVRYFVTLRATCSGGQTLSSSNGVTIINETDVAKSLIISTGLDCEASLKQKEPSDVLLSSSNDSFHLRTRFHVGNMYYLQMKKNDVKAEINVNVIGAISKIIDRYWFRIVPFSEQPLFTFTNSTKNASEIVFYVTDCRNGSYLDRTSMLHTHWSLRTNTHIPFTFEAAVGVDCISNESSSECIKQQTPFKQTRNNQSASIKVDPQDTTAVYKMLVRPCIHGKCFSYVASSGVRPLDRGNQLDILKAKLTAGDCLDLEAQWKMAPRAEVMFFQWGVSKDPNATHCLTRWTTVLAGRDRVYNITSCVTIPVVSHETLYLCVKAYSWSSMSYMECSKLIWDSEKRGMQNSVYEFDSSLPSFQSLEKLLDSQYLGDKMTELLDNEVDFANSSSTVTAALSLASERNITWYLMTSKHVPTTCLFTPDCIASFNTTSAGYVVFKPNTIPKNTMLYSCAFSTSTIVQRENQEDHLADIASCSDGFVIDTVKPTAGNIMVANHDGYITDINHAVVYWTGFSDNINTRPLGYMDPIKYYTISAGSIAGSENLYPKTNIGLHHTYMFEGMNIPDGIGFFITVTATDHAGQETPAFTDRLVVDASPPTTGEISIDGNQVSMAVISSRTVDIDVTGFEDTHSGIDYFEVGIGSRPRSCDVIPLKEYFTNRIHIDLNPCHLEDGKHYFIVVQAVNRAGLKTEPLSKLFTVDRTAPSGGHVLDGLDNQKDFDYQANDSYIGGHWFGFNDVHTGILYYRVGLGSRPYRDDEEPMVDVGLRTHAVWRKSFTPGTKYYIMVEACNEAGLCSLVSSDGVILDHSVPIPGRVRVGHSDTHGKYQSKNTSIHIQWSGFSDPESGIDHFEACFGTRQMVCDVHPYFNCLLSSSITKTGLDIPVNGGVYATVKAFNKVGMYVVGTSDAFVVDLSPPTLIQAPSIVKRFNNIANHRIQYDPSVLRVQWEFEDTDSPIVKHYVTLKTHHEGHSPIDNKEYGPINKVTFPLDKEDWLHDGDTYYVIVTSCNAAGLCTSAESDSVRVDSTPPHQGGFTSDLTWKNHPNGTAELSLSWHSFVDVESGVDKFYITISRNYSGSELSNGTISTAYINGTNIQNGTFRLTDLLKPDNRIFLTIWAANMAGLNSSVSRVSVNVLVTNAGPQNYNGILELEKHSCKPQFCSGDCTCAVVGKPCEKPSCTSKAFLNNSLNVPDLHIFWGLPGMEQTVTTSSACLAAHWNSTSTTSMSSGNGTPSTVLRYEYSIGLHDEDFGTGIFNQDRVPWVDVGLRKEMVYCLGNGMHLVHDKAYVFYVRAWLTKDEFYTYASNQINIDQTIPSIRKGSRVIDADSSCRNDLDIIDWMHSVTGCWINVFQEQQGKIIHYTVSLGTSEKADDIMTSRNVGLQTSVTVTNITLQHGTKYFFTVVAYNDVGLHTTLTSDGFLVDMDTPRTGAVFNTDKYRNSHYQSDSSTLSLSWTGFSDDQSGIKSYLAGFIDDTYINETSSIDNNSNMFRNETVMVNDLHLANITYHKVGLLTKYTFANLNLVEGRRYYGVVKAIDAGGHESDIAVSKGRLVDTTGPEGFKCIVYEQLDSSSSSTFANGSNYTSFQTDFVLDGLYKIKGFINKSESNVRVYFENGEHRLRLPTVVNHNGSAQFEYSFLSPYDGLRHVSLSINSNIGIYVDTDFMRCKDVQPALDSVVDIRQIGPTRLVVNVLVRDKESSIYKVLIGAGSTRGGFQVQSLQPILGGNDEVLEVNVPHGTPVHVTAIVENHAGLRNTFFSNQIVFDLTPPLLSIVSSTVKIVSGPGADFNDTVGNHVVINVTWAVSDSESGVRLCYCSFGNSPGSEDLLAYRPAGTDTSCSSKPLLVSHGATVYGNVRCVNSVELKSEATTDPLIFVSQPPSADGSKVCFIPLGADKGLEENILNTLNGSNNTLTIQSATDRLTFEWEGFWDASGIDRYEYRIMEERRVLVDWTETKKTSTTVRFDDKTLEAGKSYRVEVLAVNGENLRSLSRSAAIVVDDREPQLSGRRMHVSQAGRIVTINWASVFLTHSLFSCHFSVSIGTKQGTADIADISHRDDVEAEIVLPASGSGFSGDPVQELYIDVECTYPTGLSRLAEFNYRLV